MTANTSGSVGQSDRAHALLHRLKIQLKNYAILDQNQSLVGEVTDLNLESGNRFNLVVSQPDVHKGNRLFLVNSRWVNRVDSANRAIHINLSEGDVVHLPDFYAPQPSYAGESPLNPLMSPAVELGGDHPSSTDDTIPYDQPATMIEEELAPIKVTNVPLAESSPAQYDATPSSDFEFEFADDIAALDEPDSYSSELDSLYQPDYDSYNSNLELEEDSAYTSYHPNVPDDNHDGVVEANVVPDSPDTKFSDPEIFTALSNTALSEMTPSGESASDLASDDLAQDAKVVHLLEETLMVNRDRRKIGQVVVRKEIETYIVEVPMRRETLIVEQVSPEYRELARIDLAQNDESESDRILNETDYELARINLQSPTDDELSRQTTAGKPLVSGTFKSPGRASQFLTEIAKLIHHRCDEIRVELVLKDDTLQETYQNWFEHFSDH